MKFHVSRVRVILSVNSVTRDRRTITLNGEQRKEMRDYKGRIYFSLNRICIFDIGGKVNLRVLLVLWVFF